MYRCDCCIVYFFFFFKQKTAYEMRISDWSSDVCSSDLDIAAQLQRLFEGQPIGRGEALTHSAGPKAEDVDPTIGDPIVPERNGRPTAPRLHPRLGARF